MNEEYKGRVKVAHARACEAEDEGWGHMVMVDDRYCSSLTSKGKAMHELKDRVGCKGRRAVKPDSGQVAR